MPTQTPGADPASSVDYIAELRRQAKLLKTGALQGAIFNSANFSSIATDAAGVIQIFNVGAARMLGYAAIDVMDKIMPAELSDPEELVARAAALSLELGGTDNTVRRKLADELVQYRQNLEELVSSRTAELIETRGTAEAAGRAKRAFLAHMSHELHTPMNGIMGMTNMALRYATDPRQIDALTKAALLSRQLMALIDDLLDISNTETGQLALDEQAFSLKRALSDCVVPFEVPALAKGLSLTLEISPLLPSALWGAVARLQQTLGNLVSNAIKFSERGRIRVRVSPAQLDAGSVLLRIDVIDEGPGLTPDQQARVFGVFSQVEDSPTRQYGGSGLGLAIARRLAKLMDGDAGVVSVAGVGSNFWFTARLARSERLELSSTVSRPA